MISAQKLLMARAGAVPVSPAWKVTKIVEPTGPNYRRLTGVFFAIGTSGDGNYVYSTSSGDFQIEQYGMSTPYNVRSLELQNSSYSIYSVVGGMRDGLQVVNGGQTVIGCADGSLQQVSLTTPYNTSSATSGSGVTFNWSANVTDPRSIYVKPDGTEVYTISGGNNISRFTLSTPFNISTASHTSTTSLGITAGAALWFKPDGTKLYVVRGRTIILDGSIREYTLSTPWDTSTIGAATTRSLPYAGSSLDSTTYGWNGLFFSDTGNAVFVHRNSSPNRDGNGGLFKYDLSTAWDLTTATFSFGADTYQGIISAGQFNPDNTKIIAVSTSSVVEYNLSTPSDISTVSVGNSFSVSSQTSSARDVKFSPDGTKMFVLSPTNLFRYDLGTAWNVTTAVYNSNNFSASVQETNCHTFGISEDGTVVMIQGHNDDRIFQYNLSTAWDLSTATYTAVSAATDYNSAQMFWKPDGSKVFMIGNDGPRWEEYTLTTPWNIATITAGTSGSAVYSGLPKFTYGDTSHIWSPDGSFAIVNVARFNVTIKFNLV